MRDVVRAYRLLLEKGEAGRMYVIGSNCRLKIGKLLQLIAEQVGVSSAAEVDPALWRSTDASKELDVSRWKSLAGKLKSRLGGRCSTCPFEAAAKSDELAEERLGRDNCRIGVQEAVHVLERQVEDNLEGVLCAG